MYLPAAKWLNLQKAKSKICGQSALASTARQPNPASPQVHHTHKMSQATTDFYRRFSNIYLWNGFQVLHSDGLNIFKCGPIHQFETPDMALIWKIKLISLKLNKFYIKKTVHCCEFKSWKLYNHDHFSFVFFREEHFRLPNPMLWEGLDKLWHLLGKIPGIFPHTNVGILQPLHDRCS